MTTGQSELVASRSQSSGEGRALILLSEALTAVFDVNGSSGRAALSRSNTAAMSINSPIAPKSATSA